MEILSNESLLYLEKAKSIKQNLLLIIQKQSTQKNRYE